MTQKLNPWDLYECHKQFSAANRAINAAWEKAKSIAPSKPAKERAALASEYVYKVLERYKHVGACDSEPRAELRHRVREHFGVDGGWI